MLDTLVFWCMSIANAKHVRTTPRTRVSGAQAGGLIGTAIEPGGGTAVGGAIGGFVGGLFGGIAGAFGGSWLAEETATSAINANSQSSPGTNTGYEEATFLAH